MAWCISAIIVVTQPGLCILGVYNVMTTIYTIYGDIIYSWDLCMRKGKFGLRLHVWPSFYAISETCETITETWKHWDAWARFTKYAQTKILTFEFHMYSGLNVNLSDVLIRPNSTLWYMLRHQAHNSNSNDTWGYLLRDHFPPWVIRYLCVTTIWYSETCL